MKIRRIALALVVAGAAASAVAQDRQLYIVQLANEPAASYSGGVAGYAATKPAPGGKLDINATNVAAYIGYLEAQQNNAIAQVSNAAIVHRYKVAFNGFSALLTEAEANKLKGASNVVAVTPDEERSVDTTRTPAFLGLTAAGGLWSKLDGNGRIVKGEDIILGIVDGGIWPENASFSDKVDPVTLKPVPYFAPGTVVYGPPPAKWRGTCVAGQGFTQAMCNNKLIGAQFFNAGFVASGRVLWPTDYVGPRDEDGHGSHTASTAGGNENADAVINGVNVGSMSGMAPRARIAAYRVCYSFRNAANARQNSCFVSDSVAAIDKAVADGVDVINFSIGGSQTNYLDPVSVAFFNANVAGVFVTAAGGNNGPSNLQGGPPNQVSHPGPWNMSVAASTHDRFMVASVTLGNGATFSGPSYSTGVPSTPTILSTDAGMLPFAQLSAADQLALSRCYNAADRADPTLGTPASPAAALDPAKVAGKTVVCIRGGNVLVNKANAVKTAGGAAMILQNTPATANTQPLIVYEVPTVHLAAAASGPVLAYAATAGATSSFSAAVFVPGVVAPVIADFSSRGPTRANPNVLKPDLAAPGVDVFAAYVADDVDSQAVHDAIVAGTLVPSPAATSLQGTSMASPHIAGIAALLRQLHPTWTPAMIKSALMTTATPGKLANGTNDINPFNFGAGHVNPNAAMNPGLVYDATPIDYLRFLCGIGSLPATAAQCVAFGTITPWNLNLPSITAADVLGRVSITRTVTNVGSSPATYTGSASVPGWTVALQPSTLAVAPGASATYRINLTRTTAPIGAYSAGSVVWTNGQQTVKSPLTVRGALFAAPASVADSRAAGTKLYTVGTGYDGVLPVSPSGLVAANRINGAVGTGQTQCFNVVVPAGTMAARFQLFNSDTQGGSATDLDLIVVRGANGAGTIVGTSGGVTSDELVDLANPVAATYSACVQGFATVGGPAAYTLSVFVVGPPASPQSLAALSPAKVYTGGTATIGLSWSVPTGNRYLGVVRYSDGTNVIGSTLFAVDAR